jgi:hypothetical protein
VLFAAIIMGIKIRCIFPVIVNSVGPVTL